MEREDIKDISEQFSKWDSLSLEEKVKLVELQLCWNLQFDSMNSLENEWNKQLLEVIQGLEERYNKIT